MENGLNLPGGSRSGSTGELLRGISIARPGWMGEEFFMTRGQFHAVLDTAGVYYYLIGEGVMVIESPVGDWAVEKLRSDSVLYVPPRWLPPEAR